MPNAVEFRSSSSHCTLALGWLPSAPIICLESQTGTVTELRERSDTHVSGYGNYIRSRHAIVQELWLRGESGTEACIKVSNWGIAARRGHKMTIVWGSVPQRRTAKPLFCCNHTTGAITHADAFVRNHLSPNVSVWRFLKFLGWLVGRIRVCLVMGTIISPLYQLSVLAMGAGLVAHTLFFKPLPHEPDRAIA